jgi:hypothetical protein
LDITQNYDGEDHTDATTDITETVATTDITQTTMQKTSSFWDVRRSFSCGFLFGFFLGSEPGQNKDPEEDEKGAAGHDKAVTVGILF